MTAQLTQMNIANETCKASLTQTASAPANLKLSQHASSPPLKQGAGWGKTWFKHHVYKGRIIITSGLNMFEPMGGPTLPGSQQNPTPTDQTPPGRVKRVVESERAIAARLGPLICIFLIDTPWSTSSSYRPGPRASHEKTQKDSVVQ